MQRRKFREVALERLSTPERLDDLIEVTTPRLWLALCGAGALLLAAIGWGLYGSVPTIVRGQGILIRDGSLQTVDAPAAGQVKDVFFKVGDEVQKDQVVARVVQPGDDRSVVVTSPYTGFVL